MNELNENFFGGVFGDSCSSFVYEFLGDCFSFLSS